MKMCKTLLAALLAVAMMVSLCACVGGEPDDKTDGTTTTTPTTTTTTKATVDDSQVTYTVKVLDENGAPVVGAMLQTCNDAGCIPHMIPTDATGTISFQRPKGEEYDLKFVMPVAGYDVDINNVYAEINEDTTEVTITVNKAA